MEEEGGSTDRPDLTCFNRVDIKTFSLFAGVFLTFVGVIITLTCLFMGYPLGVLLGVIWTVVVPVSLVYGIIRERRFFYKPFIIISRILGCVAILLSLGVMLNAFFNNCTEMCGQHCNFAKYGGPLFAFSVGNFYFADVIDRSLKLLNKTK